MSILANKRSVFVDFKKSHNTLSKMSKVVYFGIYQGNTETQIKILKEEIAKPQQKNEASENKYKDPEDWFHEKSTKATKKFGI